MRKFVVLTLLYLYISESLIWSPLAAILTFPSVPASSTAKRGFSRHLVAAHRAGHLRTALGRRGHVTALPER